MLAELLPGDVRVAELLHDPPGLALHADEERSVARAVPARRREFTTGRHCARLALAELGIAVESIPKAARGAPGWPPGVVGSITHCAGYRAAAVAWDTELLGLGIDAEPCQPLPERVADLVCRPRERRELDGLHEADPQVPWDRLLFSAKESVYKVWAPVAGTFLDFDDVHVVFDAASGSFVARVLVAGAETQLPGGRLSGRFLTRDGLLLTAVACAREPRSS